MKFVGVASPGANVVVHSRFIIWKFLTCNVFRVIMRKSYKRKADWRNVGGACRVRTREKIYLRIVL